jgi:RNase P/RNase MRP subunit POP5
VVGGERALEGVSAFTRDVSEEVQDAATRVLGEWITADAAPVLLDLATEGSGKFKIRTLRGYIRIARQLDVPTAERIAMCRKALAVAERDDERKLVLETLARYPSGESLAVVTPFLDDPALKRAASAAAVAIADVLVKTDAAPVAEAMPKAAEAAGDAELSERAQTLLKRAKARLRRK